MWCSQGAVPLQPKLIPTSPSFTACTFSTLPRNYRSCNRPFLPVPNQFREWLHWNPTSPNKRGPLQLHCLLEGACCAAGDWVVVDASEGTGTCSLGKGGGGRDSDRLEVPQDWILGSCWQSALPAQIAACSLLLCFPSFFYSTLLVNAVWRGVRLFMGVCDTVLQWVPKSSQNQLRSA